jgi:hypothetical protein
LSCGPAAVCPAGGNELDVAIIVIDANDIVLDNRFTHPWQ